MTTTADMLAISRAIRALIHNLNALRDYLTDEDDGDEADPEIMADMLEIVFDTLDVVTALLDREQIGTLQ